MVTVYVVSSASGFVDVHAYWVCPYTDVNTPSVAGVMENAFSTSAIATERENEMRKRASVGTSFCPFLKFVLTVVGSVFSYARNAPTPTSTTNSASPAETATRRPDRGGRRRMGRLRREAGGKDAGSSSGSDVEIDNGPRGLCH